MLKLKRDPNEPRPTLGAGSMAFVALIAGFVGVDVLIDVWAVGINLGEHNLGFGAYIETRADRPKTVGAGIVFGVSLVLMAMALGIRAYQRRAEDKGVIEHTHNPDQAGANCDDDCQPQTNPLGPDESRGGLFKRLAAAFSLIGDLIKATILGGHPLDRAALVFLLVGVWGSRLADWGLSG